MVTSTKKKAIPFLYGIIWVALVLGTAVYWFLVAEPIFTREGLFTFTNFSDKLLFCAGFLSPSLFVYKVFNKLLGTDMTVKLIIVYHVIMLGLVIFAITQANAVNDSLRVVSRFIGAFFIWSIFFKTVWKEMAGFGGKDK